jgi:hypothetical protein
LYHKSKKLQQWFPCEEVKDEKDLPEVLSAIFRFRFGGILFRSSGSGEQLRVI